VLFEGQYRKAKAKGECPNTKAAILIDGKGAGSIFYLCQTDKCDVHNRVTRYQPPPQEQAQHKKEALAERVEKLSRVRILEAIRKKLPEVLSRLELEMVALDYFRRLGHDNHRRLSKLYAWEEKKSKTSWGAQTVDYEKIAAADVQAMKAPDVNRFLVVCARFRPVLPRLQSEAIAGEGLQPRTSGAFAEERRSGQEARIRQGVRKKPSTNDTQEKITDANKDSKGPRLRARPFVSQVTPADYLTDEMLCRTASGAAVIFYIPRSWRARRANAAARRIPEIAK
jgi:hypothetical protein